MTDGFVTIFHGTLLFLLVISVLYFCNQRRKVLNFQEKMKFLKATQDTRKINKQVTYPTTKQFVVSLPTQRSTPEASLKQDFDDDFEDFHPRSYVQKAKLRVSERQITSGLLEPPIEAPKPVIRVGIIGGGLSAYITAQEFVKRDYDVKVLESNCEALGKWAPTFKRSLAIPMKYFVDWKLPSDFPKDTSEPNMQKYLNEYLDSTNLREIVHFNTQVTKIIKRFKGGFAVHCTTKNDLDLSYVFDIVILSSGMFTNPLVVDINGNPTTSATNDKPKPQVAVSKAAKQGSGVLSHSTYPCSGSIAALAKERTQLQGQMEAV